jgi:hypothetical protein
VWTSAVQHEIAYDVFGRASGSLVGVRNYRDELRLFQFRKFRKIGELIFRLLLLHSRSRWLDFGLLVLHCHSNGSSFDFRHLEKRNFHNLRTGVRRACVQFPFDVL